MTKKRVDCAELHVAYQRAQLVHLRAWQQLATFQDASGADADPTRLSSIDRARLKQLADISAATARAWTQAFDSWWRLCSECI
jgi:hypothetical protein